MRGGRLFVQDYWRHFIPAHAQTGAVFLVNGSIAGLEIFDSASTFIKMFRVLLDSYCLDAIDWFVNASVSRQVHIKSFMADIASAPAQTGNSVGLGSDIRFETPGYIGCARVLHDRVVHLSAFSKSPVHISGGSPFEHGRHNSRAGYSVTI